MAATKILTELERQHSNMEAQRTVSLPEKQRGTATTATQTSGRSALLDGVQRQRRQRPNNS